MPAKRPGAAFDRGKLTKREALAVELIGNHFNITMRVDTDSESAYPHNLAYADTEPSGRSR